ncbi:hypothetical protein [Mycoplasma leonicaptivi]|uniref:hypothetical protein n=1 Tax=Mycoplasma leonicaptivi TaxID=36742 RepID=UPI0004876D10|nr:hypothetical protein [Mycoplasma leonicaptivi]
MNNTFKFINTLGNVATVANSFNAQNSSIISKINTTTSEFDPNFERIINKLSKDKGKYGERFSRLSEEEKKVLLIESVKKLDIDSTKKNLILNKLKSDTELFNGYTNIFIRKSEEQIIKIKSVVNKNLIKTKDLPKKIRLKSEHGFINESADISSKKIYSKIYEYNEEIEKFKKEKKDLLNKKKSLQTASTVLNSIQIILGILSAGSFIASFFGFGLPAILTTPLVAVISFVSGIQIVVNAFLTHIDYLIKNLNQYTEIIDFVKNVASSSFTFEVFSKFVKDSKKFILPVLKKPISNVLNFLGFSITIQSLVTDVKELQDTFNKFSEIEEKKSFIIKEALKLKNITNFVVIGETEQYGEYNNNGFGGKNIYFKNLEENKIYSLNEMLKKDDNYLYLNNLIKVFDKNKGWYIKSLPNKIKEDNLG